MLGFDNSESLLGQITCECVTLNYCYGNNNNDNNNKKPQYMYAIDTTCLFAKFGLTFPVCTRIYNTMKNH